MKTDKIYYYLFQDLQKHRELSELTNYKLRRLKRLKVSFKKLVGDDQLGG
jgi:hypothetical protein